MIFLGADAAQKNAIITRRAAGRRVFYCGPAVATGESGGDRIRFEDSIRYIHFYRWLREIDGAALLVFDEPLRKHDRGDLHLNCMRQYAAQAGETIVFSYFPIIDDPQDFMVLFDLATKSRWRRSRLEDAPLGEVETIVFGARSVRFVPQIVAVDSELVTRVAAKKKELIDNIDDADPHTIPRRLYQETGSVRYDAVHKSETLLVGRNNRFKMSRLVSYEKADTRPRVVFELCHEHAVFNAWLSHARQSEVKVLVADVKIDRWYFDRYVTWGTKLAATYQAVCP